MRSFENRLADARMILRNSEKLPSYRTLTLGAWAGGAVCLTGVVGVLCAGVSTAAIPAAAAVVGGYAVMGACQDAKDKLVIDCMTE